MHRQNRTPARGQLVQQSRSPQPHTPQPAPPVYPAAPNAALLIDFDNVTMGIRSELATELKSLLSSDVVKGKIAIRRAYADWRRYPQYVLPLTETSIDLIYAPAYGSARKNATDIRLAIDAMELVFTRPEIGTIVLLSGDSDFSSLVIKLKEYGKYIIGVGIRESSSDLLVQNCDEYYSYNALAGLVKTGDEPATKWDPWELASEAVTRMKRNDDVMRADRLKQVMQEIDNTFEEKNLGMSKFSIFVKEAAQRGLLQITKLDNGQLEVDVPAVPADVMTPPPAPLAPATARSEAAVVPETVNGDRDSSRDRGRRGRGGRVRRDRRDGATPPSQTQPTAQTSETAAVVAPASGTGERLTRAEALELVRKAVEDLSGAAGKAISATLVRERARALLGRDSETLSERYFTRILQDAHDADMIDLRRRGDDYEVARVVPTPSVGAQLTSAAMAANHPGTGGQSAASATPAPATPARLQSRAGRAGFGKKLGEAPPSLLSVGVVDFGIPQTEPLHVVQHAPPAAAPDVKLDAVSTPADAPDEKKRKGRGPRGGAVRKKAASVGQTAGAALAKAAGKRPARKSARKRAGSKTPSSVEAVTE